MRSPSTDENNGMHGVNVATKIFAQYGEFIRAIIRSKTAQQGYEEDLYHDFFLSLAHKPPPDGIKNIKSYLYRAITHDIVDAIRRINAYRTRLKKYSEERKDYVNMSKSGNASDYSEDIDRVLKAIVRQLPVGQSKAIILRYKYGYEIKEIAEEMCIDSRSVSRYISIGLKTIKKFFAEKQRSSND